MEEAKFIQSLKSYSGISELLRTHRYEDMLTQASSLLGIAPAELELYPMGGLNKEKTTGSYHFVLQDLIQNIHHYDWLYNRFEDACSKAVLANLIGFRILPVPSFLKAAYDGCNHQYFDKSIVSCNKDEVFVDCGGFTGDTAEDYIRQHGAYQKIYVYEPSSDNIEVCRSNLNDYPNIILRNCGVGEKTAAMPIAGSKSSSRIMDIAAGDQEEHVPIVSLDEDIRENVTFIKMDVEGFEIPAILGAKNHIAEDNPKLAICLHHVPSDLWEIPRLIDAIRPDYRFYLRHYHETQNWETVLYAIPDQGHAAPTVKKARKTVAALAPSMWHNSQLVKDCGLVPYLLHKNHSCDVRMVSAPSDESYSNLNYVPGLQMEFLPDDSAASRRQYILTHARDIDCLILYGCRANVYKEAAHLYKQVNPTGKIYLALDANSHWMDRIQWTNPDFSLLMDSCDVIATSCKQMQSHLNEKWPWKIEYIPNGFYDFTCGAVPSSLEKKENMILTVSRLGTPQKRTGLLLEAFARIAPEVPDWTLQLTGTVETEFEPFIEDFFLRFPELKTRIIFSGPISDRIELYKTYQKAKIFALPSWYEGGTPNVVAEALNFGCAMAVTKFDAYSEAISNGRCGFAAEIDDTEDFANALLHLCKNSDLEAMYQHAIQTRQTTFDMVRIVDRLYCMLFD